MLESDSWPVHIRKSHWLGGGEIDQEAQAENSWTAKNGVGLELGWRSSWPRGEETCWSVWLHLCETCHRASLLLISCPWGTEAEASPFAASPSTLYWQSLPLCQLQRRHVYSVQLKYGNNGQRKLDLKLRSNKWLTVFIREFEWEGRDFHWFITNWSQKFYKAQVESFFLCNRRIRK